MNLQPSPVLPYSGRDMMLYILLALGLLGMVIVRLWHMKHIEHPFRQSLQHWFRIDSHRFENYTRRHRKRLSSYLRKADRLSDKAVYTLAQYIEQSVHHTKRYVRRKLFVKKQKLPYNTPTFIKQMKEGE